MSALPRKTPCATCPYRIGVPSGVWHPDEYEKLPRYDLDTMSQPPQAFMCHQQDETVCSGWLGYDEPYRLLAVRLGLMDGRLDPSCADYSTDVALHGSGAEAAEHGLAEVDQPDDRAVAAMRKLQRARGVQR